MIALLSVVNCNSLIDKGFMRRYWAFYWPLLLTSIVIQLESQFQNRTLAQYAADGRELAVFANASSAFHSTNALLIFIPQLVTVMALTPGAARRTQRFALFFGLALALPLFFMAYTAGGGASLQAVFGVPDAFIGPVQGYLQWLAPLIILEAQIFHNVGRLLLEKRTKVITRLNLLHMGVLVGLLETGRYLGWRSVVTLAVATITANLAHWATTEIAVRRPGARAACPGGATASYRELWAFYWPLALTGVLFSVSRPIIYRYVNFLPAAEAQTTIAALRVAFDAGFIFQAPVNQLRNLFTTFGQDEQPRVRRFTLYVSGAYSLIMVAAAFTPLSRLFFRDLVKLDGEVLALTVGAFAVLCLNPLIIAVRNIYHGELLNRHRTGGMALGALLRALLIWLLSLGCYYAGWLNHYTGAGLMIFGFAIETLAAWLAVVRLDRAGCKSFLR